MSETPALTSPRVSVVMSVYNGERYLAEAIDSILGQSMSDLELIVIDDGSTDGTPRILEKYTARDERVWVVRNDLQNAADAAALAAARAARTGIQRRCRSTSSVPIVSPRLTSRIGIRMSVRISLPSLIVQRSAT